MLSHELMKILVCPVCNGDLVAEEPAGLLCGPCGLLFPVRGDIPVMLVDEAQRVVPRKPAGPAP